MLGHTERELLEKSKLVKQNNDLINSMAELIREQKKTNELLEDLINKGLVNNTTIVQQEQSKEKKIFASEENMFVPTIDLDYKFNEKMKVDERQREKDIDSSINKLKKVKSGEDDE